MKKVLLVGFGFVSLAMVVVAADFRRIPNMLHEEKVEQTCVGYTIIEYDKGIDCYGDTILLERKHGFATRKSEL
jgi:hypothetical protein